MYMDPDRTNPIYKITHKGRRKDLLKYYVRAYLNNLLYFWNAIIVKELRKSAKFYAPTFSGGMMII